MVKGNPLGGQNFNTVSGYSFFVEGETAKYCIPIHGLWPMVWLDSYGLGRKMIGKLIRKRLGKRYMDSPLRMGEKCESICVPCECLSKNDFSSRAFLIIKWTG